MSLLLRIRGIFNRPLMGGIDWSVSKVGHSAYSLIIIFHSKSETTRVTQAPSAYEPRISMPLLQPSHNIKYYHKSQEIVCVINQPRQLPCAVFGIEEPSKIKNKGSSAG